MKGYRDNPESEENTRSTRDNRRSVFAAQMDAKLRNRWEMKHLIQDKNGQTQSIGFTVFDHKPTPEEIDDLREDLLIANVWATTVILLASSTPEHTQE